MVAYIWTTSSIISHIFIIISFVVNSLLPLDLYLYVVSLLFNKIKTFHRVPWIGHCPTGNP
jgi:hypothetical protein